MSDFHLKAKQDYGRDARTVGDFKLERLKQPSRNTGGAGGERGTIASYAIMARARYQETGSQPC